MRILTLSMAVTAALVLGACSSNAPRYDPAPTENTPIPQAMSLHDRVHDALEHEMGSAASEIKIRVEGSTVYLTGHVRSHEDHDRAPRIANAVSGVTSVNHDGLQTH